MNILIIFGFIPRSLDTRSRSTVASLISHFHSGVRGRRVWWDFGAQGVAGIHWDDQAGSDWTAERSSWTHQDRDVIHLMAQDWINRLLDVARRQGWSCVDTPQQWRFSLSRLCDWRVRQEQEGCFRTSTGDPESSLGESWTKRTRGNQS